MKVIVRTYGDIARAFSGKLNVELEDGAKLRDLILKLGGKIESSGTVSLGSYKLNDHALVVLVNGHNIHALDGIDTTLKDGDFITFMPVLGGG